MIISYASYFVAYLLYRLEKEDINKIRNIILFGSAAKGTASKNSDVDIFIDIKSKSKALEYKLRKILQDFYQSRESLLFEAKGISNKIDLKIGGLSEWKSLNRDIASAGIMLYSQYEIKTAPPDIKHYIIIYWNKINKNRGAFLNKIYGFNSKGKQYLGLLNKFGGKRLGKSCIIIPFINKDEFLKLLRDYNVEAKSMEVFA